MTQKTTIIAVCLIAVLGIWSRTMGQVGPVDKYPNEMRKRIRVFDPQGTLVPPGDGLVASSSRTVVIGNRYITTKGWVVKPNFDGVVNERIANKSRSSTIRSSPVRLLGLQSFEAEGRVFAYRANYGLLKYRQKDATTALSGCMLVVFYIDENGDGQFESVYSDDRDLDHLPDWVMARSRKVFDSVSSNIKSKTADHGPFDRL